MACSCLHAIVINVNGSAKENPGNRGWQWEKGMSTYLAVMVGIVVRVVGIVGDACICVWWGQVVVGKYVGVDAVIYRWGGITWDKEVVQHASVGSGLKWDGRAAEWKWCKRWKGT
jgi:hypothetical protein